MDNKGISLVAVTVVMLLIAVFSLVVASLMSTADISSVTDIQEQQVFYVAEAGMEWYLEELEHNNNWKTPPVVKTNQQFGSGTFSITYADESVHQIDITSTGKITGWDGNTVQRVITRHISKEKGHMQTSLWQEVL